MTTRAGGREITTTYSAYELASLIRDYPKFATKTVERWFDTADGKPRPGVSKHRWGSNGGWHRVISEAGMMDMLKENGIPEERIEYIKQKHHGKHQEQEQRALERAAKLKAHKAEPKPEPKPPKRGPGRARRPRRTAATRAS